MVESGSGIIQYTSSGSYDINLTINGQEEQASYLSEEFIQDFITIEFAFMFILGICIVVYKNLFPKYM